MKNSSHQTPPPPHQAGVATLQEVANPPLVAGGKDAASPLATGARLEPGRPAARAGPTRATCVGRPSWRPTCCPWPPWPTKVQTAEEAGSRPPAARMPAVRMPGRLESRRPWMPAARMPAARMPTARMPAARMPVHLAPLLQRRRPGHKEGPCRPRCWPADKEEAQSGPPVAADWPVPLIPSLT